MTKTSKLMLAVLAVCGTSAAMAQSSVNLYGRVITSVENHKVGKTSTTGMAGGTSFFGLKGVEDLGGGLKAGFILESAFTSDNGSGTSTGSTGLDFSRNSELNLSSGFGTLRLGAFDPASLLATTDAVSMHNHDTGVSADALHTVAGISKNKIAYVSPEFAGFVGEVQYAFGEKAGYKADGTGTDAETRNAWDLGLTYGIGALGLGFGYSNENFKNNGGFGAKQSKDQYALRATYAIGDLTLAGYYQRAQDKTVNGENKKWNAYRLAAMYVLGASEFHANYGRLSNTKTNGVTQRNTKANQWTLAYNYNLSKRTKAYALYTNVSNAAAQTKGSPMSTLTVGAGQDVRAYGVGIRHLF